MTVSKGSRGGPNDRFEHRDGASGPGRKTAQAQLVIDGTVTAVARRPLQKSQAARAAAGEALRLTHVAPERDEPTAAEIAARAFGRHRRAAGPGSGSATRRPDLVFPGDRDRHFQPRLRPDAASTSPVDARRRIRNAAMVAALFLLGFLAIPVFLVATPESPAAAPYVATSASGLTIEDVKAGLAPRGDGAVLSVSGTISNPTRANATIPPLRIALANAEGDVLARPLATTVGRLAAGSSIRFLSTLAVPSGLSGDVSVRFEDPMAGRPMITVRGKTIETLFDAEAIRAEVLRIAAEIAEEEPTDLLVVSVLKGSFIFAADLIRALHLVGLAPEVEFISLSSYGSGTQGGEVRVLRDVESEVAGRTVILIDDILESGRTIKFARDLMLERGAAQAKIAVLLDKRMRRKAEVEADFVGFDCPDYFVVGYGMDVGHAFRELPFVGRVID